MTVNGIKWSFFNRQRDVTDRTEHHNSKYHHQRLQPHHLIATNDTQVEASGKGPPAQCDRPLQPPRS